MSLHRLATIPLVYRADTPYLRNRGLFSESPSPRSGHALRPFPNLATSNIPILQKETFANLLNPPTKHRWNYGSLVARVVNVPHQYYLKMSFTVLF